MDAAEPRQWGQLNWRLEPWILREAIPLLEETDLSQASDVVARMDAAEPRQWGQLNWQLHEHLYRAARRRRWA